MKCSMCGQDIKEIDSNEIPVYRKSDYNKKLGIETVRKVYCSPEHSLDDYLSDRRKEFMDKPSDTE